MTLLDLVARWLRSHGANVDTTARGVRVSLSVEDYLVEILGSQFSLEPAEPTTPLPPGVEPVFPGSRITDLLAGDLESVQGIALVRASSQTTGPSPIFVFTFLATFATDAHVERLIRLALTADGQSVPLPSESVDPLESAGEAVHWRGAVERLWPVAIDAVLGSAQVDVARESRDAQYRLYRTVRRLALLYSRRTASTHTEDERTAEFRRLVAEEVDRHRMRVSIALMGVTIHI